ncbi:cupin domain-containing protein [Mumia zhuanghuii]|uniref:Cupin domain-containing protein n=2 Tax=Mumia TaxID=1546255 RepID=A0ABW1QT63_9ACTN|nr:MULTISPECIES: cupin domain-containing protein [Mumia]KAA1424521.1 cupin domain-containing protein [Mumia zhuanghuii]
MTHARDRLLTDATLSHPLEVDGPDPDDVVAGSPTTASAELGSLGETRVGIWEITAGTVRDVEVDEMFVVLAGDATVRFEDGSTIALRPGVVVRLHAGDRTVWEVRETLRKVYVV